MTTIEITPATIRFTAMNLLSMREHSAKELREKLIKKYPQYPSIDEVIDRLTQDRLQSDERFAEAFIGMRKRQGKGSLIITMELKERGVSIHIINNLLEPGNVSWKLLASVVRQKKFGEFLPQNVKEKSKQIRFLVGRGFTASCIQYALEYSAKNSDEFLIK